MTQPTTKKPLVEVETIKDGSGDDFPAAIAEHVAQLALAMDRPDRILENTVDWVKENYSEKVYTAYWATLTRTHVRDKGFALDVGTLPLGLRLRLLVGQHSGGFGMFTPDRRISGSIKASIGLGLVAEYDNWRSLSPVASFAIHF